MVCLCNGSVTKLFPGVVYFWTLAQLEDLGRSIARLERTRTSKHPLLSSAHKALKTCRSGARARCTHRILTKCIRKLVQCQTDGFHFVSTSPEWNLLCFVLANSTWWCHHWSSVSASLNVTLGSPFCQESSQQVSCVVDHWTPASSVCFFFFCFVFPPATCHVGNTQKNRLQC